MHKIFKASDIILDTQKRTVSNSFDPTDDEYRVYIEPESPIDTIEKAYNEKEVILLRAKSEAFRVVKEANEQAERIVSDANAQCEKLKQETADEAKKLGYEEGYASAVRECEGLKRDAEKIHNAAVEARDKMFKNIEPDAIDLIIRIVRKLLNDIAELNPQVIQNLIVQGLTDVTVTGNIIIHVSKQDYDHVIENKEIILSRLESGANVEIVRDPALNKSDCIIETPFGNIDCSLEQQFESLKQNLYFIFNNSVNKEEDGYTAFTEM